MARPDRNRNAEAQKRWRARHPGRNYYCWRKWRYKARYGITMEEYEKQLLRQGGRCAVCRTKGKRNLAVDHDHTTKKFRGLLCGGCNRGIGLLRDSPLLLRRAIAYLRKKEAAK